MGTILAAGTIDGRRLIAIFLICTAGITFILVLCRGEQIFAAHRVATWPTVQGAVIVSKTSDTCKGHRGLRRDVSYTYIVAGHRYTGSQIAFGPDSCVSEGRAAGIVALYPIGNVTVWFDPRHPEKAALLVGNVLAETWSSIYWSAAVSVVSLLLAIWCLRAAGSKERRWNAEES
jgi:hypothetical protein